MFFSDVGDVAVGLGVVGGDVGASFETLSFRLRFFGDFVADAAKASMNMSLSCKNAAANEKKNNN